MTEPEEKIVHLDAVRRALDAAEPVEPANPVEPPKPPRPRADGLPDDCPVIALGTEGSVYHFLDPLRQLRTVPAGKMARLEIESLFQLHHHWLEKHWPRFAKSGKVDGPNYNQAAQELFAACARRGVWSALDRIRGAGAWSDDDGALILHCGDQVLIIDRDGRERAEAPGLIGDCVYPAAAPLPRPAAGVAAGAAAAELLALLRTWAWRRPDLDPVLLLGWIGAALLGGATKWRPHAWLTGGSGTGKSTLKDRVLGPVFDGGSVAVSDTSEAGLRQALRYSTLPAIIDELEASADDRRAQQTMMLARLSSTGGLILRGGADHAGQQFVTRSCFLMQAILIPALSPQDRSRVAILELNALGDRRMPPLDAGRLREIGRLLRRRVVQAWPRLPAVYARYDEALRAAGGSGPMDSRASEEFSSLLAAAEVLLYDDPEEMDASTRGWADLVRASEPSPAERGCDEDELVQRILSTAVDAKRDGGRKTIAEWIARAHGLTGGDVEAARQICGTYGLWIGSLTLPGGAYPSPVVGVANRHQGLAELLKGTHWAAGASGTPVWVQSARRFARTAGGIETSRPLWVGGVVCRCAVIPLAAIRPQPASPDPGTAESLQI
jgi:hypothetical protein